MAQPGLVDFSPIGELGDVYKKAQEQRQRDAFRQALGGLTQGGVVDYGKLVNLAAQYGQPDTLITALRGQQSAAAQSAAERHQQVMEGFEGRKVGLAETQAQEKPTYQSWEAPDGNKYIVKLNPRGQGAEIVQPAGMPTEPQSPYTPTGKITGEEAKDRLYATRMVDSHNTINGLENINQGPGGYVTGLATGVGRIRDNPLVNTMLSADRQRLIQAQRDFANAILRKESGAAISQSEFENAQRQYFPTPGDSDAVLAQKRTNRQNAIEGMMAGAGKGYKPPTGYVGTKGPAYPQGAPAAAPAAATPAAPASGGQIPQAAIDRLRANRTKQGYAEAFDEIFGVGSAARVLGVR